MKKNKIICLVLTLMLVMLFPSIVSATDYTYSSESQSAEVPITMTVDPSYTVTIPAEIEISYPSKTGSAGISAANVVIDPGMQLEVAIGGAFSVALSGDTLSFTVMKGETTILTGGTVLEVPAGTVSDPVTLTFTVDAEDSPIYAGDYTGTVTFTISVVTPTP